MTPDPKRDAFIDAVQSGIAAERNNSHKWDSLQEWFASAYGIQKKAVVAKLLTQSKQLGNRIQSELANADPEYVVLVTLKSDITEESVLKHLSQSNLPRVKCVLLFTEIAPSKLIVYEEDDLVRDLESLFSELKPEAQARPVFTPGRVAGTPAGPLTTGSLPEVSVVQIPDRIRRMIRLAVATSHAVILVGPPGTGKTTLLNELIDDVQANPGHYGFSESIKAPKWVTPDESWTTADLVGGDTVDENGDLRFRPGRVLEAIAENRWLILDEMNRADMDKIFGGLLTWLSDQPVELGRVAKNVDAPSIVLSWNDSPACDTEGTDALEEAEPTGDTVRYLAGTEWRLLGTYNAVDAQRVFRLGQAIGRRFVRVPIPPPEPAAFGEALKVLTAALPDGAHDAIVKLYECHCGDVSTELGPALFLRIPKYIAVGLQSLTESASVAPPETGGADSDEGASAEVDDDPDHEDDNWRALLAEAYVINVGTSLIRLDDDDYEALRARIVSNAGVFSSDAWKWIADCARHLA